MSDNKSEIKKEASAPEIVPNIPEAVPELKDQSVFVPQHDTKAGLFFHKGIIPIEKIREAAKTSTSFTGLAKQLGVMTGKSVSGSFCFRVLALIPDIKQSFESNKNATAKTSPESSPQSFTTIVRPKANPRKEKKIVLTEEEVLDAKKNPVKDFYGPYVEFSTLELGDRFWLSRKKYAMKWNNQTAWSPITNEKIDFAPEVKVQRLVGDICDVVRQVGINLASKGHFNPLDDIKGPGEK